MTPPSFQRKRVSQACTRCRTRKDKCCGSKPSCSTCQVGGYACSYDASVKKRGLPEGYVRGLEKMCGLVVRVCPESEERVLGFLKAEEGRGEGLWDGEGGRGREKMGVETLLDTWRGSRLCRGLENLIPQLERMDERNLKRKREGAGAILPAFEATPSAPLPPDRNLTYTSDLPDTRPPKHAATPASEPIFPASQQPTSTPSLFLELPPNTWPLLDLYFTYTHSWLPILARHTLLKAAHSHPLHLPLHDPGTGAHAALWAVLALCEAQQDGISRGVEGHVHTDTRPWQPTPIYNTARSLIPAEDGTFELGHVQALLLLSLLNMEQNRFQAAYLLCGQASRLAVELGLGTRKNNGGERGRHTYLGCFVLDTILAARLERAPCLRWEDVRRCGLLQVDGADEWDVWVDRTAVRHAEECVANARAPGRILSTFNRLVGLIGVLNTTLVARHGGGEDAGVEAQRAIMAKLAMDREFVDKGTVATPQQLHAELLFSSLAAWLHLPRHNGSLALHWLPVPELLGRWKAGYSLATVPPSLDCFTSFYLQHGSGSDATAVSALHGYLLEAAQVWPTFTRSLMQLHLQSQRQIQTPCYPSSLAPFSTAGEYTLSPHASAETDSNPPLPTPDISEIYTPTSPSGWTLPASPPPSISPSTPTLPLPLPHSVDMPYYPSPSTFSHPPPPENDTNDLSFTSFTSFAAMAGIEWPNTWEAPLLSLGFSIADNSNSAYD